MSQDQVCNFIKGPGALENPESAQHQHQHDHGGHGHSHDIPQGKGIYAEREPYTGRSDFENRAYTIGVGGPVGSGKTALLLSLCRHFGEKYNIAVITNDIFTKEDGEFLIRNNALASERIKMVETGGCPHAAIREDISANKLEVENLTETFGCDFIILESGGDNLAANFSRELADFTIYVIDVAGGDKVPRKGGPGITESDLLIINKTDIAEAVGSDLAVMDRDSKMMRGEGPTIFAQCKHNVGIPEIADLIISYVKNAGVKLSQ